PRPDEVTIAIATLLNGQEPLVVDGRKVDVRALRQLYEPWGYRPMWGGTGSTSGRGQEVAAALSHASAHGLDPAYYHRDVVVRHAGAQQPDDRAAPDVLASDGLMRLIAHLRLGAVPGRSLGGEVALEPRPLDVQELAREAAASSDLAAFLDGLAPQTPTY